MEAVNEVKALGPSKYPYNYDDMLFRLHTAKLAEETNAKINLSSLKVSYKNRVSIISNFGEYPKILNRTKEEISDFFKVETATSVSINAQEQLLIHGKFNEVKCESILKNYIRQLVMCRQCKSLNTKLEKESGLSFLDCKQCGARSSLGKI